MSAGDREHPDHANGNGHAAATGGNGNGPSALDAYLDGRLAGPERTAFESRLAGDPALAAGHAVQRGIDGSLRRMFVVPPFPGLPFAVDPAPQPGAHAPSLHAPRAAAAAVAGVAITAATGDNARRWTTTSLLIGALAAAGVLLTAVSWVTYNALADDRQSFDEVYRELAAAPAQPSATAGFASACRHSLGHQVSVTEPPPGVEVLGVREAKVLSGKTVVLRARVDGQDVLLFADHALHDDGAAARHGCGMNLFRRQVGAVVFYELTPLDAPRLLDPYAGPAEEPHGCADPAAPVEE